MNVEQGVTRSPVAYGAAAESAVSWGAVLAGAAGAAALSLLMLMLGTGLGLSSVSPWPMDGVSATTFGVATILWITLTQFLASGMGGYIAGRLRSKWDGVHTDEIHFRDSAHGFLAWAVATLATAALLTSVVGSIVSGGAKAASAVAGGVASTAAVAGAAASDDKEGTSYFADSLLRTASAPAQPAAPADGSTPASTPVPPPAADASPEMAKQVGTVLVHALKTGSLSPDDTHYLGQIVAQRSGVSQADGEKKVSDTFTALQSKTQEAETKAKEAADEARKASTKAALWMFISLLIGAFIASFAALFGGRHRIA